MINISKLYNKYLQLKDKNPSHFYLFKSGIFYIFLAEDAKKMSSILNLKLNNLNESVLKCGFPINSLQKYMNLLKTANCEVEIIDNISPNLNTNQKIENFLTKISNANPDNFSIKEIYNFLDTISKEANSLIKEFHS